MRSVKISLLTIRKSHVNINLNGFSKLVSSLSDVRLSLWLLFTADVDAPVCKSSRDEWNTFQRGGRMSPELTDYFSVGRNLPFWKKNENVK